MKTQLRYLLIMCLGVFLMGISLDTFAWGTDVTLPGITGRKYTNARLSVAYDGSVYFGRISSEPATGSMTYWEVWKSDDNGMSFSKLCGSYIGGSTICTGMDIVCAGNSETDFGLFVVRTYLDTVSGFASIYFGKYSSSGGYLSDMVYTSYTYSPARGWLSPCLATDSRDKNSLASPYSISLVAGKAGTQDSIIVWTDNEGGTALNRKGIYATYSRIRNVSASIGSIISTQSGYGRLGIAWDEYSSTTTEWGAVQVRFLYPDDGTNPPYSGPYALDGGAANFRRPCIVLAQNTAGGTGPGGQDFRAIVTTEIITSKKIWGAVFDSILMISPNYHWCLISYPFSSGTNYMCHGVFDPLYNNFLFTYYDSENNALSYSIKLANTPATADALYFRSNYRDISTGSLTDMCPRVDMSVSRGLAAFAWNDNYSGLFDAEWSTLGVKEIAGDNITGVKLYPNPASSEVNLNFTAKVDQGVIIRILDLTGKVLNSEEYNINAGENILSFPVQNLSPGNYILCLTGPGLTSSHRLVILK